MRGPRPVAESVVSFDRGLEMPRRGVAAPEERGQLSEGALDRPGVTVPHVDGNPIRVREEQVVEHFGSLGVVRGRAHLGEGS